VKPVTPLSPPPRDTRIKVETDDPSPSARQFRLPFNWLAPSGLRRIFCSDEGAGATLGVGRGVSKHFSGQVLIAKDLTEF
jgi:hypothetical protein